MLQMVEPPDTATELSRVPAGSGQNARRSRRLGYRPAALPLVLLLLALSTLFLFGGDRAYFYRDGIHDWNSSRVLGFAENLSFRHNLLIFDHLYRDADGDLQYSAPYNRFPVGGYALIKLAISPFEDTDFRAKIYAGRMLMLLLFCGGAILAYHSLARIAGSRWDALTATLLAFSSYYVLYHADKISNEAAIDVFAVMLAFHGMVIFVQEGRFWQLLVKSGLALLLGWHVYAFLLPFIVFGMIAKLLKARSMISASPTLRNLKRGASALLCSRYLLLGVVTLLFGIAILAFNFSNEYFALNREFSLRELPSVRSAVKRVSLDESYNIRYSHLLEPQVFWPRQFGRAAEVMLPFAMNILRAGTEPTQNFRYRGYPAIAMGVLVMIFCLAALAVICVRRQTGMATLLATLAVSGFCYAAMVPHYVMTHNFEILFYFGFPLAAYTLALLCLRRMSWVRLSPFFAVAALTVFAVSASQIAGLGQSRAELSVEAEYMAEYGAIRDLVGASETIYVPASYWGIGGGAAYAWSYYLSGASVVFNDGYAPRKPQQPVDYLLMRTREDSPALLTPAHRSYFLYDWELYNEWHRTANQGRPIIAEDWQVFLRDDHLTYVSPECANRDDSFFLHFIPQDTADLPASRSEYGYVNADFAFRFRGIVLTDGACVIELPLPDYDITAIRTGQYTATGRIWQGEHRLLSPAPPYSRPAKSE